MSQPVLQQPAIKAIMLNAASSASVPRFIVNPPCIFRNVRPTASLRA
jgi:hypothetical protein